MAKKSFKSKIILPTVIVLVVLVIALNVFLSVGFSALRDSLVRERLVANTNSLNLYLDESKHNSKAAAVSMAGNPAVIKAVKERDTDELLRIFTPTLDLYRINHYAICDNEGTVLARTNEPGNFGDSVLNQKNIQDALEGRVSTYFESGPTVKVSVRTGSPIYDTDGALIGVVSAGVRFDSDSAVNELKRLFNAEVTVFLGDTRIATTITIDGQSIAGTTLDPDIAEIVIGNKREYSGAVNIHGERFTAFYTPLLDVHGEVFAIFFLGIPEAEITVASKNLVRNGIIFGLGGLAVSVVLLFYIISTISGPITKLSNDMNHIANGNLRIDINVKSEDEIGHLGRSLQRVTNILQKLLEDINVMIVEHEKGNTDYCLDTGEFLGDYKILADSVLELAAFSMNDQLTGIPNRRSFDNRLDWEWTRARRDKTIISILVMDVDKFKHYNDTYGHQQGDVALQSIAQALKHSVKRSVDFVARWGGEEFIVLLPLTDSAGAVCVAEKIRREIENMAIPCAEAGGTKVTVSIGVSTQIPAHDDLVGSFISAADRALYGAKETGRNKVVFGGRGNG